MPALWTAKPSATWRRFSWRRSLRASTARRSRVHESLQFEPLEQRCVLSLAPLAVADFYKDHQGETISVDVQHGVLANDISINMSANAGLTAALHKNVAHGTLHLSDDGSFTYTPNGDFVGVDTFSYYAQDGTVNSFEPALVSINVAPPAGLVPDFYETTVGTALNIDSKHGVLANDFAPPGVTLNAVVDKGPEHGKLSLAVDGSFTYTPDVGFVGLDGFTYKAAPPTAPAGGHDSPPNLPPPLDSTPVLIAIHPNHDQLTLAIPDLYDTVQGQALTVGAEHGVLANDLAPHGVSLTAVLDKAPENGQVSLNPDGSFTYTPNSGFLGVDKFTYKANNGASDSNIAPVAISVHPAEKASILAIPDFYKTPAGQPLTVGTGDGVLANDVARDGSSLSAKLVKDAEHGKLSLAADGSFTYTPNDGFVGVDHFTYQASNGASDSNIAPVAIHVAPTANSAPLAIDDYYGDDAGKTLTIGGEDGVLRNDIAWSKAPLTASLADKPANGSVTLNPDGSFTYSPTTGFIGNDTFTYKDNDGTNDSNVATVTIHVHAPKVHVPIAVPDLYDVAKDQALSVNAEHGVLANDIGWDKTLTAAVVDNPPNGAVTLNSDGSFTYTPKTGFVGTDVFTYKANDGTTDSNVTKVAVVVHDTQNLPPLALPDFYRVLAGGTLNVDAEHGVLRNDISVNGAPLTAAIVSQPANGAVTLNADGSFTYTPNTSFAGKDSFSYKANDGTNDSKAADVYIKVASETTHPIAVDDLYSIGPNDTSLSIGADHGVLANDHGKSLTATLLSNPAHGALSFNADGSFSYTAGDSFTGLDSFTYKANDGTADSNPALVVIARHPWQNAADPTDVDGDGKDIPLDALKLINDLNSNGIRRLAAVVANAPGTMLDVNGDGICSPVDALIIINKLNKPTGKAPSAADFGAGLAGPSAPAPAGAVSSSAGASGGSVGAAPATSVAAADAALASAAAGSNLDAILNDLATGIAATRKSTDTSDAVFEQLG